MNDIVKQVPKSGYLSLQKLKGKTIKISEVIVIEKANENSSEVQT